MLQSPPHLNIIEGLQMFVLCQVMTFLILRQKKSGFPVPTSELVNQYIPETKIKNGMTGLWSGLDSSMARSELGYQDKHVWEDYIRGDGSKINK